MKVQKGWIPKALKYGFPQDKWQHTFLETQKQFSSPTALFAHYAVNKEIAAVEIELLVISI